MTPDICFCFLLMYVTYAKIFAHICDHIQQFVNLFIDLLINCQILLPCKMVKPTKIMSKIKQDRFRNDCLFPTKGVDQDQYIYFDGNALRVCLLGSFKFSEWLISVLDTLVNCENIINQIVTQKHIS